LGQGGGSLGLAFSRKDEDWAFTDDRENSALVKENEKAIRFEKTDI